jgi:[acyl-carrier-protein] S-malonyltransferase
MNMAFLQLLINREIVPDIVAGHSLGQFSALAAAGVLSLYDLFQIVNRRAELMNQLKESGKLATVIGLQKEVIEEICNEISAETGKVSIALENTKNQFVIGGREPDVNRAVEKLKKIGAIRILEIKVSNAFHTYLMQSMVEPFQTFLDTVEWKNPKARILLNAKGDYATSLGEVKEDVIKQCTNTVKWKDCLSQLLQENELCLAEVGVGKTMESLVRGMNTGQKTFLISNNKDFEQFISSARQEEMCYESII